MAQVAVIGTLDTKGKELRFLINEIQRHNVRAVVLDVGILPQTTLVPDYPAHEICRLGGVELQDLQTNYNRVNVQKVMGAGAACLVKQLIAEEKISGIIAMGGGQGANIAAAVMRELPLGFPKLIISTEVSVPKRQIFFEGCLDWFGVNPTTDVAGLHSVMKRTMSNAAAAIAAMALNYAQTKTDFLSELPKVGISMLGITTKCASAVARKLETAGYEPMIYHAIGYGGGNLERMIEAGQIQGVIEVTPSEVAAQIIGNGCAAEGGTPRLKAAAEKGIPIVLSLGGLDHFNFVGELPEIFRSRLHISISSKACSVRTTMEENAVFGHVIAERLNEAKGPVVVVIPTEGFSQFDKLGGPFYNPQIDAVLRETLREALSDRIQVVEYQGHINDEACAELLFTEFMRLQKS